MWYKITAFFLISQPETLKGGKMHLFSCNAMYHKSLSSNYPPLTYFIFILSSCRFKHFLYLAKNISRTHFHSLFFFGNFAGFPLISRYDRVVLWYIKWSLKTLILLKNAHFQLMEAKRINWKLLLCLSIRVTLWLSNDGKIRMLLT